MDPAQTSALSLAFTILVFGGGAALCVLIVLSGGYRVVLHNGLVARVGEYREAVTAVRRKMHEQRIEEIREMRGRVRDYRNARENERRRIHRDLGLDFDETERDASVAELESRVGDCNRLVQEKRDTVATFVQVLTNQSQPARAGEARRRSFGTSSHDLGSIGLRIRPDFLIRNTRHRSARP